MSGISEEKLIKIFKIIIDISLLAGVLFYFMRSCELKNNSVGNAEAICIMENSSAKETVIWNTLIHDDRLYPVESEKRDGCLIIYEGGMEKGYSFAVFVDNDYDHCCVDGE